MYNLTFSAKDGIKVNKMQRLTLFKQSKTVKNRVDGLV